MPNIPMMKRLRSALDTESLEAFEGALVSIAEQFFADADARQRWQRTAPPRTARQIDGLDARRRKMARVNAKDPAIRDVWKQVKALHANLAEQGLAPMVTMKVESSTLKKNVKDRLAKGQAVPSFYNFRSFDKATFTKGAPKTPEF